MWAPWEEFNEKVASHGFLMPSLFQLEVSRKFGQEAYSNACMYWAEKSREFISSGGRAVSDRRGGILGYRSAYLDHLSSIKTDSEFVCLQPEIRNFLACIRGEGGGEFLHRMEDLLKIERRNFIDNYFPGVDKCSDAIRVVQELCGAESVSPSKSVRQEIKDRGIPVPKTGYLISCEAGEEVFSWCVKSRFGESFDWYNVCSCNAGMVLCMGWDFVAPGYSYYNSRNDLEAGLYSTYMNGVLAKEFLNAKMILRSVAQDRKAQ